MKFAWHGFIYWRSYKLQSTLKRVQSRYCTNRLTSSIYNKMGPHYLKQLNSKLKLGCAHFNIDEWMMNRSHLYATLSKKLFCFLISLRQSVTLTSLIDIGTATSFHFFFVTYLYNFV